MKRAFWLPDRFLLMLVGAIALAWLAPVRGVAATVFDPITLLAVALLFFLHGAKLSRAAVVRGAGHWRLHLCVLATTFAVFPLIALVGKPGLELLLTPTLVAGVIYLCAVPSTVQSSIAFTSIAQGNVPAAVCSASLSNMLGVVATPLIASAMIGLHGGGVSFAAVGHIALEIVLPFALGQAVRRWVGGWIEAHPGIVKCVDQGSIVLIVYDAFSASVAAGLWQQTPASAIGILVGLDVLLLALVLIVTWMVGRRFFQRADEVVLVFCGSKKTLAGGVPIAKVLFASGSLGAVILPLMLFHQLQLFACAVIARRYGAAADARAAATAAQ